MTSEFVIDFEMDAFEAEVYAAAQEAFARLQRDFNGESFYTFNLVTGDLSQYVTVFANSEEELARNAKEHKLPPGVDLSLEDRKHLLRYSLHNNKFNFGDVGTANDESFANATELLARLRASLDALEERLIDEEDMDEDEYDDLVFEHVHEPIEAALKRVMQRLDREGAFEVTNARDNIHLGVLSAGDQGEPMGPFRDLNPPEACAKYAEDAKAYQQAIHNMRDGSQPKRKRRWFRLF